MVPLCAVLLAVAALAAEPPPPEHSVTLTDEVGEYAWRPKLATGAWAFVPVLKTGVLALTESFPYPYPILRRSPYGMAGVKAVYSGAVDLAAVATVGAVNLRSRRLLDDPGLLLATPATRHAGRDLSQNQLVESLYLDAGKRFEVGGGWKAAVYASFDQFSLLPRDSLTELYEGSVGTAWLHSRGNNEFSLSAGLAGEWARKNFYRNDGPLEIAPSGRAGLEYARREGATRYLIGTDFETRRADNAIRPYVGLEGKRASVLLAGEFRRGSDPFYPDVQGAAASVTTRLTKGLTLGLTASRESQSYALAPAPVEEVKASAQLTWNVSDNLVVKSRQAWQKRRQEEYEERRQLELNAASAASPQRGDIRALIAVSPTLPDFLRSYKPGGEMGILNAVAEFTGLFDKYSYNKNEGGTPNLDSVDAIYQRARQSYLTGTSDPILVCLGAAQSAAYLAEEMGRLSGVPIRATAATVKTADEKGRAQGHAVAAVKTPGLGIVFVDWGRLIPTYTFDTQRAFRVYQALVGLPATFHQISDSQRNGRHVGYLFTEEGKLYVRQLTFHGELGRSPVAELFGDDPRGDQVAGQRYKDLLRGQSP